MANIFIQKSGGGGSTKGYDSTSDSWKVQEVAPTLKVSSIEKQSVSTVPTDTETTVLSFTVTGSDLFVKHVEGTGTGATSEWFIYINTVLKMVKRMSITNPFIDIPMYDFKLAVGDVIDVKVKHYEVATQSFDSSVQYYR